MRLYDKPVCQSDIVIQNLNCNLFKKKLLNWFKIIIVTSTKPIYLNNSTVSVDNYYCHPSWDHMLLINFELPNYTLHIHVRSKLDKVKYILVNLWARCKCWIWIWIQRTTLFWIRQEIIYSLSEDLKIVTLVSNLESVRN